MAQLRKAKDNKWNSKQLSYAVRATSFIHRAIAMRKRLVKLGKSQRPHKEVTAALLYLSAWFAQPLNSAHAATLIYRHYDKVMILLPGREAKNHESMIQEFQHLVNEAVDILYAGQEQTKPQLQQV